MRVPSENIVRAVGGQMTPPPALAVKAKAELRPAAARQGR